MGLEEAPSPQSALSAFSPPGPFSGEKRNYLGARGFQRSPRGQRCSGSAAPCLANTGTPEKHWRPWLAELLFRFEPAPPFDSDPAEQRKRFLEPPPVSPGSIRQGEGGRAAPRVRSGSVPRPGTPARLPGAAPPADPAVPAPGWSGAEGGRGGGARFPEQARQLSRVGEDPRAGLVGKRKLPVTSPEHVLKAPK